MTDIVVTPPAVISITATSPNAYTITATQPDTITITAALGASGTVTSIATTAPITGGIITGSGTIGISAATTAAAGSMSASDKTKLDGIETGAEVNNISDANATDLTDGGVTSLHRHDLSLGSEELTNGLFELDASGWTLGAGWAWAGESQVQHTAENTGTVSQAGELIDGYTYLASIVIAGTTGTVQVQFGAGDTFELSPTYGFNVSIGLSGRWNTSAGYKILFLPSSDFDGFISTVSMKKQTFIQDANRDALYYVRKDGVWEAASIHAQQHAITSTSDHTSTATSGQMLKADANGLPVNATNTDAQVAAAVTASHAAVTVADSASIDMTLTGQQVSAAAIFGTGAGVVAEGNHTHYSYYTLQTLSVAAFNPADGATYYFGGENVANPTGGTRNIPIPFAGTIVYAACVILVNTTLGDATTFSAYIRVNGSTDLTITTSAQATAAIQKYSTSSLSHAVAVNDYFEGKIVFPTWPTTNPTNVKGYFVVGIRV